MNNNDDNGPIRYVSQKRLNRRMRYAGSGVSALVIGIIILIVSLTIIPIVNQIYNDYHNINKLSKVAKEKEEEFDELQQERNLNKLSQDYEKYLKRKYAITKDLEYRNGVTIPTFYKYVISYRPVDYNILIETNEVAENNSVLKLLYTVRRQFYEKEENSKYSDGCCHYCYRSIGNPGCRSYQRLV